MQDEPLATSEPHDDDPLADLRWRIKRLHIHNGEPSTRIISARTGKAISHTTVHAVLRCVRLPTWGQLELVVEQLGGDVEEFRGLWIQARDAQHGIASEAPRPIASKTEDISKTHYPATDPSLAQDRESDRALTQPISELFVGFLDNLEKAGTESLVKVSTGHVDLDLLLGGGMSSGQLVLIAGRPAIGKSTFVLNICRHAAINQGLPALLMTSRMTKEEIIRRLTSAEARIPLHVLRAGMLSDDDWTRLAHRLNDIHDAPLFINDAYKPSLSTVVAEARRVATEYGVKLVVVDSVQQLLEHHEADLRRLEAAEVSRTLKLLSLELQVPVVAVCGVNHNPDERRDGPPRAPELEDLSDADEDADIVIIVHRDDYYDVQSPRVGEVDLIVSRHRDGPTDTVTVAAQLHLCRFVDMATTAF